MKKIVLVILVVLMFSMTGFMLAACSSTTPSTGAVWANYEQLTYEIKEGDTVIGELVTTIEKLNAGAVYLTKVREEAFNISSSSTRGMRYSQLAKDNEGNVIMEAESLMNGYSTLASYKKVNYKDNNYEVKGYLDGKYYKFWFDGVEQKRVKVGADFIDNELLYSFFRAYKDIDSGYTKSVSVIDTLTGKSESFSMTASTERKAFNVKYQTVDKEEHAKNVDCIVTTVKKSSSPVGSSMEVWYTESSFKINGTTEIAGNQSYHIPVKIIENNLTYNLTMAKAFKEAAEE